MHSSIAHLLPREWVRLSPPEQKGLLDLFSKHGVVFYEPRKLSKQCVLTEDGWLRLWHDLCTSSAVTLLSRDKARFIFRGELARNRFVSKRQNDLLGDQQSAGSMGCKPGFLGGSYALRSPGPHVTFVGFAHCFFACAARVPGGLATLRLAGATTVLAQRQSSPRAATSPGATRPRSVVHEVEQQPEQRWQPDDLWPPSPAQICERFPGTLREEIHVSGQTAFGFTSAAKASAHRLSLQPKRELVLMSGASEETATDGRNAPPTTPGEAHKPGAGTPTSITADWTALQAVGSAGSESGGSEAAGGPAGGNAAGGPPTSERRVNDAKLQHRPP